MKSFAPILLGLFFSSVLRGESRPNIVLILADDLGRDWVGCYGAQQATPHVDRLAKQGVRYETAWGDPSRVSLSTGRYSFRRDGKTPPTFARVLRDSGYVTAIGGKHGQAHQNDFDEHCLWTGQADGSILTNGERSTVASGPEAINDFLIDFVRRRKSKPFLSYYPMLLPHGPDAVVPWKKESPPAGGRVLYAQNVARMDRLAGRLIAAIDREGLKENTLVVFTSDNGSPFAGWLHGEPYSAGKGKAADCGVHVPLIARAPFLTAGGRVSRDLIDFTDLFPTFLELAKTTASPEIPRDGKSFVPSLRGSDDPFDKRSWICSQLDQTRMIRDWQHILDSRGGFHDLGLDPLQKSAVSPQDKIAPGRRRRLQMILDRFP